MTVTAEDKNEPGHSFLLIVGIDASIGYFAQKLFRAKVNWMFKA